jgi:Rrf2 family nitric oxide-sensitive transcriptional repressor
MKHASAIHLSETGLSSSPTIASAGRRGNSRAARAGPDMRLTTFTDYTLRVLIYLGAHEQGGRLATISDVATAYDIPRSHLTKIVNHLARKGYVKTTRGKGGGMRLARAPGEIAIGDVVRSTEEDLAVAECFRNGHCGCPILPVCALRGVLERALGEFLKVLDGQTLSDLLKSRAQFVRMLGTPGSGDASSTGQDRAGTG